MTGPQEPHAGLPPELVASPDFQHACRKRDFSQIFQLAKKKAGIYPSRIAALCGMTPSRVGEIMSGRRSLAHIDVIERVADGLRIPGAMLGLAHRPWEIPVGPVATEQAPGHFRPAEPDSAAQEAAEPSGIDELLTLADGKVTRSTLVALQSSVEDYWRRDDEHGGAALRPAVVGHLRYVSQLMNGAEGSLRHDLQSLAAELARLAGWAYFDARQYSTARTHFSQALRLSRGQGDYLFMANVLSCMSLQATYDGNPADAVALACKAQDSAREAGAQPLVMSMLHMREAFAQATLRDSMACHQALDRSRDAYELARGRETEAPSWVRYFDESKLIVDTGIALARLGDSARAEPLIAEGLRRESATQQRGRAFHAFWLATAQLQQGSLDAACASATLALDLTASLDSPRVAGHVREFHQRLAPYAQETPVVAFEQKMREILG
ncbi:helix-turn-helix domain-containing protein [Streptomyces sp. NBC_01795]|uniref:helix-turn-helix domain-containing protein n=1 Tax=Streptomyces sp. NBC_01795 TaxID=2975943 RepID=UPI002DD9753D|nr:helix-turn-helix domain-containing protein [Streptomyces sp. NBC_01795]WSA93345.1 helix-turn-helix domain-containing protein [Streptomyces sp. NBC_01795]